MKKILITGGRGLIGQELSKRLACLGYQVCWLTRSEEKKSINRYLTYTWDYTNNYLEEGALEGVYAIVHLAGANIGEKRWSNRRKQEIIDSRTKTANLLFKCISEKNIDLKVFISASAVGYYGTTTSDYIYRENDLKGNDFLSDVCANWEKSVLTFQEIKIRTVILRTSVVLSDNGGVLSKMLLPTKLGINAPIGTGKQYLPWIHIDDLCNLYIASIENTSLSGVYNAVASEQITNYCFSKELSLVLHKPFFMPNIPSFIIKLIFGEMAVILLNGSRISNEKILQTNFRFTFPTIKEALTNLFLQV